MQLSVLRKMLWGQLQQDQMTFTPFILESKYCSLFLISITCYLLTVVTLSIPFRTVEINNTDAEGRLVLADGVSIYSAMNQCLQCQHALLMLYDYVILCPGILCQERLEGRTNS